VGAQSYTHTHTHTHVYIYIYMFVCVCVCPCVCDWRGVRQRALTQTYIYTRILRKLSSELVAASFRISNISSNLFLSTVNIPVGSERNFIVLVAAKAGYIYIYIYIYIYS